MTDIARTVETFVELAADFQIELDATSDQELSDMKYHLYLVPASKQWEVMYEYVYPPFKLRPAEPDMEAIYNGDLTDFQRGQQILRSVVDEEYPMPAIAGPITQAMLPRYSERKLSSAFSRMLPRLRTAARLLSCPDDEVVDESSADTGDSVRSEFALATATIPPAFRDNTNAPIGPLVGSGTALAKAVTGRKNATRKVLWRCYNNGQVFVKNASHSREFEAYFHTWEKHNAAKGKLKTATNNT